MFAGRASPFKRLAFRHCQQASRYVAVFQADGPSEMRSVIVGESSFRHVLAVLGDDPGVAHDAAALAGTHGARLSLVQTWSPPFALWGLGSPVILPTGLSHESVLSGLATAADDRVRAIVRQLAHPGPLEYWCRRGRVSTVAFDAARSAKYDAVVVPNCLASRGLSWLATSGPSASRKPEC